ASGSDACPDKCPDKYEPVRDDTGVEHTNECRMRMAQCLTNDASTRAALPPRARPPSTRTTRSPAATTTSCGSDACPDKCPEIYKPVKDDTGVEHVNECAMRMAQC
ncbi:hypothetical protein PHYSODRAFT_420139, partial [Phytophthora sojae]